MSLRRWLLGKLQALALDEVRSLEADWGERLAAESSRRLQGETVIADQRKMLAVAAAAQEQLTEELAQRMRELRELLREKSKLTEELERRHAAVINADRRVVVNAMRLTMDSLHPLVQEAACYAVEKIAQDIHIPRGSMLGKSLRRDEACEWAAHFLRERKFPYRDSDVHLACELYYHLNQRGA